MQLHLSKQPSIKFLETITTQQKRVPFHSSVHNYMFVLKVKQTSTEICYAIFDILMKTYLHSNNGIYEEKHSNKETDVRKSLLEKRQQRQLIKTCHKSKMNLLYCQKNIIASLCEESKWRERRPWKIVQRSTAEYGWCNPVSAAWSTWPHGKASGNSCWWCSPTGTGAQVDGERMREGGWEWQTEGRDRMGNTDGENHHNMT